MSVKPILFNTEMVRAILDGHKTVTRRVVKPQPMGYFEVNDNPVFLYDFDPIAERLYSPYQPGDILYVRETWQKTYSNDGTTHPTNFKYEYKVSDEQRTVYRWKPSIHMPKEAARIWLNVTNVRVERLQDITGDQAVMEGTKEEFPPLAKDEFMVIWDSTIKKVDIDRYGWKANPWVWVIEFERCEKPQEVEQ